MKSDITITEQTLERVISECRMNIYSFKSAIQNNKGDKKFILSSIKKQRRMIREAKWKLFFLHVVTRSR